ncbi:hypothetical protein MMC15_004138 [Xylographa vitiligo]|nr:hypothetical protein [Xylographa vitiligo]
MAQPRTPSLQEPGVIENSEGLTLGLGYNQDRAKTLESSPDGVTNHDLTDALTLEIRTPTSSMLEGYVPMNQDDATKEYGLAGMDRYSEQAVELTAQVRIQNPRRRASQVPYTHKVVLSFLWPSTINLHIYLSSRWTMPEGYYEAISRHIRRRPPAVPQKHLPSRDAGGTSRSSKITNDESESSDQEELRSTRVQDIQIGSDAELELMKASSAVQRIIRRMNKTIRTTANDEC